MAPFQQRIPERLERFPRDERLYPQRNEFETESLQLQRQSVRDAEQCCAAGAAAARVPDGSNTE